MQVIQEKSAVFEQISVDEIISGKCKTKKATPKVALRNKTIFRLPSRKLDRFDGFFPI